MNVDMKVVPSGSATSPKGFRAGATCAGIKKKAALDLGILCSETPAVTAAVFTKNRVKAAPVILSKSRLRGGRASVVVVNSGCANACTGEQGMKDAIEMTELAAAKVGVTASSVLVASTGVIGEYLPMDKIRAGINRIALSSEGGHDLERAMMTTDTVPKEIAVRVGGYTIGGVAKGSGMIHPNLATLLSFLTTDASLAIDFLRQALRKAADISFNMVAVDEDTSTNDTVLIMANGLAGNKTISAGKKEAEVFQQALDYVCTCLAKAIARDGEGATKMIEVAVKGASNPREARIVAKTVICSSLVKTAVHGNDPNWGRIVAAVGRSGVRMVEAKISLAIGGVGVLKKGKRLNPGESEVSKALDCGEVHVDIDLNMGSASATAWGCDLSEEYVKINSQYMT